ncbi:MAG: glycoside hydrolase family 5 protein, partial [Thermofilaceae archaeon]
LLSASVVFDSECLLQGLAWGAWGIPVNLVAGRRFMVFRLGDVYSVEVPVKHEQGKYTLYWGSASAVLVDYGDTTLGLIFPEGVATISIEDEREWGSEMISFRVWFTTSLLRYKEGDSVSISAAIVLNLNRSAIADISTILHTIAATKSIVAYSVERNQITSTLNEARNLLYELRVAEASELADKAYMEALSTVETAYEFHWLKTYDRWLVSEKGFYVILRGVNYMGMEFGWFGHSEEDFARISGWGFNAVRLPIGWAYLEPEPGRYSEEYLRLIDKVIVWCKIHGLYVVLDMHQWRWGPKYGGCGMPDWVTPNASSEEEAAKEFFSKPELWEKLAEAWKVVAQRYRDEPAVAAYDLFNEPPLYSGISLEWLTQQAKALYYYLIEEVRKVDKRHILFYEPVWGGIFEGTPVIADYNVALTVHTYIGGTADGLTGYERTTQAEMEREIKRWVDLGSRYSLAIWVGEFGVGSAAYKAREWASDITSLFDKYALGYAWWSYWRDHEGMGLLFPNGTEKKAIVDAITRPFPARSSTPVYTIRFNARAGIFEYVFYPAEYALTSTRGPFEAEFRIGLPHLPDFLSSYRIQCNQSKCFYAYDTKTSVLRVSCEETVGYIGIAFQPLGSEDPSEVESKELENTTTSSNISSKGLLIAVLYAVTVTLLVVLILIYRKIRK